MLHLNSLGVGLAIMFSLLAFPLTAQIPELHGAKSREHIPKASKTQILTVKQALMPMVEAVSELEDYHSTMTFQRRVSIKGVPVQIDYTLQDWRDRSCDFYQIMDLRVDKRSARLVTFGNETSSTIFSTSRKQYYVLEGENSVNSKDHARFEHASYIGFLYSEIFLDATLNVLEPHQANIETTSETLSGVSCTKIIIGTAPLQSVYWYSAEAPHLPIAFTNSAIIDGESVKFNADISWTHGLEQIPNTLSRELPEGFTMTDEYRDLIVSPLDEFWLAVRDRNTDTTHQIEKLEEVIVSPPGPPWQDW